MKTRTATLMKLDSGAPAQVEIPVVKAGKRPARRGGFWPGENFATATRKWDLTGVFSNNAFVLPALLASKGSLAH
jgi:hypothetical protein